MYFINLSNHSSAMTYNLSRNQTSDLIRTSLADSASIPGTITFNSDASGNSKFYFYSLLES